MSAILKPHEKETMTLHALGFTKKKSCGKKHDKQKGKSVAVKMLCNNLLYTQCKRWALAQLRPGLSNII